MKKTENINTIKNTIHNNGAFTQGLIWNYISLIFMAISGLAFSVIIGLYYGTETVGYFNTFYAWYTVASQVAVLGCHNAVLKYVSESPEDNRRAKSYVVNAISIIILLSLVINCISRMILCILNEKVHFSSVEVNSLLIGIFIFSVNKIILMYFNALSKMVVHGILQTLRYVFLVGFIVLFSVLKMERHYLLMSFLCSEVLLFLVELVFLANTGKWEFKIDKEKLKKIWEFSLKITPSNFVLELNSKADILCVSTIIANEKITGIYSFAALFAEGFYQLYVIIRRSINPQISFRYKRGEISEYSKSVNALISRFGYLGSIICGIIVVFLHKAGCLILNDAMYADGTVILVIIVASIIFNERSIVWGNYLSQIGKPTYESIVNIVTVSSNIFFNIVFINCFGMTGAAVGTALSYFVYSIIQGTLMRKAKELRA